MSAPTIHPATPAWYDLVGRWRAKANEFEDAYRRLVSERPDAHTHPQLFAQWRQLVASSAVTRKRITEIANALSAAHHAFSQASDSLSRNPIFEAAARAGTSAWDWIKRETGLGELGFLPILITSAVIAASLAAITYKLVEMHEFSQRLAEVAKLEAKGVAPAQAASIVQGLAPRSSSFSLISGSTGKYLALAAGGVALFFLLSNRGGRHG